MTLTGVLASEWIKLRSLRSTWVTLLCAVLALPGIGIVTCYLYARRWDTMTPAARVGFDPTMHSIGGVYLAQLAIGVLGVLIISGEYSTGMIRATLTAVPRRLPVLWAKVSVYSVVPFC